jgi:antitoxin HigA-1
MMDETDDRDLLMKLPPVHPGRTLAAELKARGLSARALALELRVPASRISDIVRGRQSITVDTALRLGFCLGTGARFWMNLQTHYDLARARQTHGKTIDREVADVG